MSENDFPKQFKPFYLMPVFWFCLSSFFFMFLIAIDWAHEYAVLYSVITSALGVLFLLVFAWCIGKEQSSKFSENIVLQRAIEQNPDRIFITDLDGDIIYSNLSFKKFSELLNGNIVKESK